MNSAGRIDERSDEALVNEARNGSPAAFSELAKRHRQKVFRLIFGMSGNAADADDLAQEAFLAAYRSLARFRGRSGFSTWLYRIAVNTTLNFLKKRGREKSRVEFSEDLPVGAGPGRPPGDPEARSLRTELEARVREAVDALPPRLRAAFVLVTDRGMSHAEAGRVLGCSENTVSWRMHKARRALRSRLEPYLKEASS